MSEDIQLDQLFREYRKACPEPEPGVNFMPDIWRKIDTRPSFWLVFPRLARTLTTASAALLLVLLVLNFASSSQYRGLAPTYTDALLADHTAEKTYFAEAIRATTPGADSVSAQPNR